MKKLISALVLGIILLSSVSFSNLETVEASTVESDSTESVVTLQNSGYLSDGRPRPIDVY